MKKTNTSLLDEQEIPFLAPAPKGTDWKATQWNFFHLSKVAYYFSVTQCEKYVGNDDMRDPDATIDGTLRDNLDPIISFLQYYEQNGMPASIGSEIRNCDWLNMTKRDVIKMLSPEAKKMRTIKIRARARREERRKNGFVGSVE
jgi:hypothetical protein